MKLKEIRTRHIVKGLNKLCWDYMGYAFLISAVVIAVKPEAFLGTMEYSYANGSHTFAAFVYSLQETLMGFRDWIIFAMIVELVRTNWAWVEKNLILEEHGDNAQYLNEKFKYQRHFTKLKEMIKW